MKDGFFNINDDNKLKVISLIRSAKPKIVIANCENDRHPDHGRAAELIKTCCFLSGLEKITTKYNNLISRYLEARTIYFIISSTIKLYQM